jgi:hypothetical protein
MRIEEEQSCSCAQLMNHYVMKTYGGSGCIDSRCLDLDISGRWVLSFRPCRFTPGERPQYLFDGRLGGPQNRSGRYDGNISESTGTRTPTPGWSSPYTFAIPTEISRFP